MSADEKWPIPLSTDPDFAVPNGSQDQGGYPSQRGYYTEARSHAPYTESKRRLATSRSQGCARPSRAESWIPPCTPSQTTTSASVGASHPPSRRWPRYGNNSIRQLTVSGAGSEPICAAGTARAPECGEINGAYDSNELRRHPPRTYRHIHEHVHEHRHVHRHSPRQAPTSLGQAPWFAPYPARYRTDGPNRPRVQVPRTTTSRRPGYEYEYVIQRSYRDDNAKPPCTAKSNVQASNARPRRGNAYSPQAGAGAPSTTAQGNAYHSFPPVEYDWYARNLQNDRRDRHHRFSTRRAETEAARVPPREPKTASTLPSNLRARYKSEYAHDSDRRRLVSQMQQVQPWVRARPVPPTAYRWLCFARRNESDDSSQPPRPCG